MSQDLAFMSMYEVSKLIKEYKVSPVELVDACTKRTEALQDKLFAYITFLGEQAKEDAKAAEAEIMANGPKSPMHGIPIALKDLYYTKGILTTAGSKFFKDFVPEYNATVLDRMLDAGAINMGKTNTHSWAFAAHSESQYGQSRNPWDPSKIPGGSSGGSGIACSTGMAYVAMGTETGGSIRIPAAFCGCVGYKPTYGFTSQYGIVPLSYSLDHIGPLCRSVMDAAITADIITGFDPNDPCPERYTGAHSNFAQELEGVEGLKGMVIGIPKNFFLDKLSPGIAKVFWDAVGRMKEQGAIIKEIEMPLVERAHEASHVILFSEAAHYHQHRFRENPEGFSAMDQSRIKQGLGYTNLQYVEAMLLREKLKRAWIEAAKDVDAVCFPTTANEAFKVGTSHEMTNMTVEINGEMENVNEMIGRLVRIGTITGMPAVSVPGGFTDEHMPVGISFYGKNRYRDVDALKVAWAYEKLNPFTFYTGE